MKVLVTGAAGVLGKAVVSLLEKGKEKVELRLTDVIPLETPHEFVRADLARWEAVEHLCEGIDEVLHIGAIHPWKKYTPEQYIDCNIKGTHNILRAAVGAKVRRVIYTSSIAVMGYRPDYPGQLPYDESKPCKPVENIYGISKHVGEQLCEMFCFSDGLCYIALRPGYFVPRSEGDPSVGFSYLMGRAHFSDVAMAHVLALRSAVRNEAIIITAKAPFSSNDGPALLKDAGPVILRYFPRASLLQERGIELPQAITRCYNIEKAERLLGFRPKFNFREWLERTLSQ